jgi:hypothetical protein
MLEDYLAQQPIATWNRARGVWETSQVNLLCGHSALWQEVWPTSGIAVNGQVFALPTPAHRTTVLESLLLRSPTASQGEGGALGEEEARKRGNTVGIRDQAMDLAKLNGERVSREQVNLMPTPNTMDYLPARTPEQKAANKGKGGYSNVRETVVNDLMPTPTTRDYKDGSEPHERDGIVQTDTVARAVFNSGEVQLPTPTASDWKGANHSGSGSASSRGISTVVQQTNWGKFEPAIRRWEETLGRPAPAPTRPDGKDGAHRLSPEFTEFMMGVPEGWITDCGLTRNEELKACGNGVVPQQAALALRVLLEGIPLPAGGGQVNLPTPTVSDTFTDNLKSSQQKEGSMHSVTLPQAVRMVAVELEAGQELSTLDPQTDKPPIGIEKSTAEVRQ